MHELIETVVAHDNAEATLRIPQIHFVAINQKPRGVKNAPPKRGISVEMGCVSRPNRQPLVTTGPGVGYFPIGALPTGYLPIGALPTGAGAGGGGCLRGRSAAAAALSIAKDAAAAVSIFSMM